MEMLALRGGIQINSKSTLLKSRMQFYEAATDLGEADAQAFVHAENEWLALQTSWFELAQLDIQIRKKQTLQRLRRKEVSQNSYLYKLDGNETFRSVNQKLETDIEDLDQDISDLQIQQKK